MNETEKVLEKMPKATDDVKQDFEYLYQYGDLILEKINKMITINKIVDIALIIGLILLYFKK